MKKSYYYFILWISKGRHNLVFTGVEATLCSKALKYSYMTIDQRELTFRMQVNQMIAYSYEVRKEFLSYWSEPNRSGTKMRFELEKTWDLKRRLNRWQNTPNKFNGSKPVIKEMETTSTIKEIQDMDALLTKYRLHPTEVPFSSLGKYYDYLKAEKLLKPMTSQEIEGIRKIYNGDNYKCRCYCVENTLKGYVNNNWTFHATMEARLRLVK